MHPNNHLAVSENRIDSSCHSPPLPKPKTFILDRWSLYPGHSIKGPFEPLKDFCANGLALPRCCPGAQSLRSQHSISASWHHPARVHVITLFTNTFALMRILPGFAQTFCGRTLLARIELHSGPRTQVEVTNHQMDVRIRSP